MEGERVTNVRPRPIESRYPNPVGVAGLAAFVIVGSTATRVGYARKTEQGTAERGGGARGAARVIGKGGVAAAAALLPLGALGGAAVAGGLAAEARHGFYVAGSGCSDRRRIELWQEKHGVSVNLGSAIYRARTLLERHYYAIRGVADALLAKGRISGEEVEALIRPELKSWVEVLQEQEWSV